MSARQIVLDGGSPWGFRISGGSDIGSPLKISRVNPGSKAAFKGIREGDIISSINGTSTKNIDNSTAHKLLRNAGEQLHLSLNEDGSSSPRRKSKQTNTSSTISEPKTLPGEVVTRKIVVRRYENGERDDLTTGKVKAQVHAEENVKLKNMPKKNKRFKSSNEKDSNTENVENGFTEVPTIPEVNSDMVIVEKEKKEKSFCLPLDKKLKMQLKRQKKKKKKSDLGTLNTSTTMLTLETESENSKQNITSPEEHSFVNSSTEEHAKEPEGSRSKSPLSCTPSVDETVEKKDESTSNLLTTVISREKTIDLPENLEAKYQVEAIQEDLFEDFIENQEMMEVKESVKAFPRTSPLHSPNSRRKSEKPALAVVKCSSPPKVFYNYQGMSYVASSTQPIIAEREVLTEYQNNDDTCHNRKLDVIQEESSDFSDTSAHSDKNRKTVTLTGNSHGKTEHKGSRNMSESDFNLLRRIPGKMYPVYEEIKEEISCSGTGVDSSDDVQSIIIETSNVAKTNETEDGNVHFEIDQSETSNRISDFVLPSDQDPEVDKTEDDSNAVKDMTDQHEKSTWSMKSISSTSTKLLEDESESWISSTEPELGEVINGNTESELDGQRACFIFDTYDENLNFNMSDTRSSDDEKGIEIFLVNYENRELSDRDTLGSETFLEPSLNSVTRLSSVESSHDTGLFLNKYPALIKNNLFEGINSPSLEVESMTVFNGNSNDQLKNEMNILHTPSVKNRIEAIKNEMDKILISKLKVIQSLDECKLSEATWASVLENTKNQLEKRNLKSNQTNENIENYRPVADTCPYENLCKIERSSSPVRSKVKTQNPEALSNLAEKKILTLPHGVLVLKKIGLGKCCSHNSCSETKQDLEEDMYVKSEEHPNEISIGPSELSDLSIRSVPIGIWNKVKAHSDNEFSDSRSYIEFDYGDSRIGQTEKWYGTRTMVPAVLLGLSPSQKKIYEGRCNKFMGNEAEAASLIDLHRKFIERRSYNEPNLCNAYRHLKCNGSNLKNEFVEITQISEPGTNSGAWMGSSPFINKKAQISERMIERQSVSKDVQSSNRLGWSPDVSMKTRLVGNEKPNTGDNLLKSAGRNKNGYNEKDEWKSVERIKVEKKKQVGDEFDEVVGKSCLLAILQNAISDNFVPELNKDFSIKSTSESHEVSPAEKTQETMLNSWQNNPIFRYTPSNAVQHGGTNNFYEDGRQNFERIWNKEKNITTGDVKPNGRYRPKTICCETETEVFANEPIIEKKVATVKKAPIEKLKVDDNEKLVITESLPSVSDVIEYFEEPAVPKYETYDRGRRREIVIDSERYSISRRGDIAFLQNGGNLRKKLQMEKRRSMPTSLLSEREIFNQKMYNEYMSKLAERIERRQKKVIRLSQSNEFEGLEPDVKCHDIENEFIKKVKERREKINGISSDDDKSVLLDSLEKKCQEFTSYWKDETSNIENGKALLVSGEDKDGCTTESSNSKRSSVQLILDTNADVDSLPKHLRELLEVEKEEFPDFFDGVWSPTQKVTVDKTEVKEVNQERKKLEDEPIPPVWTPKSAQASPIVEKKEFRPVNFESPVFSRKKYVQEEKRESSVPPPWQQPGGDKLPEIVKSPSSPALSLPKAPNPTVTLLQKAREGHLPRGAHYLNSGISESFGSDRSIIDKSEIGSPGKTKLDRSVKVEVTEVVPRKVTGIGPTTKEGIPLVLRSEVNEENKERWYKRMYDSLHKAGSDDDFVTIKYRTSPNRKGLYGYQGSGSGYQSEPEPLSYNLSSNKYVTLDRRRSEEAKETEPESLSRIRSSVSPPRRNIICYKNQPGRIENYEPGHCSISDLEANKWWDEVLEIFDREEEKSRTVQKVPSPRSFTNYASGDISDPQYVYKRNEEEIHSPVSSEEQKEAYKIIQRGGEIPLKGLRKPAPERPKEDSEIEYFPLSSTLTRLRVHKQNITPLSEFPFCSSSYIYRGATLNFPNLPFGVCSSYSQVQFFPSLPHPIHYPTNEPNSTVTRSSNSFFSNQNQKFSVQLQNISGPNDFVQIVPKPRSLKREAPIYANLLSTGRCASPKLSSLKEEKHSKSDSKSEENKEVTESGSKKFRFATFSELKRTAPSIISTVNAQVVLNDLDENKKILENSACEASSELFKSTPSSDDFNENQQSAPELPKSEKITKKIKRESTSGTFTVPSEKKIRKNGKKLKYPLSESVQREKSLCKSNKTLISFSKNLNKKESESSKKLSKGVVQTTKIRSDKNSLDTYSDKKPKTVKKIKPQVSFHLKDKIDEFPKEVIMYSGRDEKPKVETKITEVFRSRSFSPEVTRKIFKFPDMNKPTAPARKSSKTSPTLKMWAKMKVGYPVHKSRIDEFGSNIKFLQDKIKRKLKDVKDAKPEFEDNIETVRTVKKDKKGEMTIKTDRYIRLSRPTTFGSVATRSTYPTIEQRRVLPDIKRKFGSTNTLKSIETMTINKPISSTCRKLSPSPGTSSLKSSVKSETLERKSVKVAASVPSKDSSKKMMGISSFKKSSTFLKNTSSPCPSVGSYKSGGSGVSLPLNTDGTPSPARVTSPQVRVTSPALSASLSGSTSGESLSSRSRIQKFGSYSRLISKPITSTKLVNKTSSQTSKMTKTKDKVTKIPISKKCSEKNFVAEKKEIHKIDSLGSERIKRYDVKTTATSYTKPQKIVVKVKNKEAEENEITKGTTLVRTDSFFQNLFLRGPIDRKPTLETEKISSVLERARMYQRRIHLSNTYKSEPSLSLVTFYLNQKRPVSDSKFRRLDRNVSTPRSHSPLGSFHAENFQMRLKRFDSMSQFGDGVLYRDLSPEGKGRSSSEPPLHRSATASPEEEQICKISHSEISCSSMRSSPNSSRSPSCRRIQTYRTASKYLENHSQNKKLTSLSTQSASELEERSELNRDFTHSTSSLNLSNVSDHTEYHTYLLELMHSTRKCERFRELHKFYSNLERLGRLEKTASTGDLRPRLRNEEIIDFDRWKKVRTKERAEAELKTLVDNLMKVQKEKDLLFRAADVDSVRWKGDRGLRIKERSVENLKDHFEECVHDNADSDRWRKDLAICKDGDKSLWKGSRKGNVTTNSNASLITVEERAKTEDMKAKIGKEYGYSLKAWSSLSNEQINQLKNQLNEIYSQETQKKRVVLRADDAVEKYEIVVPKEKSLKSPGENVLKVRCSSALSKSQTDMPAIKKRELINKEWKKAESLGALPSIMSDDQDEIFLSCVSPGERINFAKLSRSHSETRYSKDSTYPLVRSKSSRPLSEDEKKRLSLSLSKEVIERMATKGSDKAPILPRETLGAVATANIKIKGRSYSPSPLHAEEKEMETLKEEFKSDRENIRKARKGNLISEIESGSGSSEASIRTVIRKNSIDVLKRVQYFEELQQNADGTFETKYEEEILSEREYDKKHGDSISESRKEKISESTQIKKGKNKKTNFKLSSSMENLNEYFGTNKKYSSLPPSKSSVIAVPPKSEPPETKNLYEESKWVPVKYSSTSPVLFKRITTRDSNDSLFSSRSRSVSPDPTKYYRAYLKMVKCGAVRKLCNKFESWEDLLSLSSDKDFWLPPAPRRFASDPELTRDLLKRYGTDPTKVTIRGQEVGDVRWLRTKFEKDANSSRGRNRFRRVRSPLVKSPITAADRYMPRINVISKKAELQMQGVTTDQESVTRAAASASEKEYTSLIDYTKDHGGFYFTGEVEKLKNKFEKLQDTEKLSILGQMYTSTPDVNELRNIAPYLECSWVAHRYPGGTKSPEPPVKKKSDIPKKVIIKPRPRSSSPPKTKATSSILKPTHPPASRSVFADQKFDPSLHRPKYRYQPEREVDRRPKRNDPDWWRHWNKPTVKFKETVSFKIDPEIRDLSPSSESPRKYVESEVTIHYKSPVRSEAKALLSDDELARRQAESMKRIYKEERRRKYLQELQDMNSRRHTDNFTPSQKSPIPLNRYDDFPECNLYSATKIREYSVDPVLVARGLYDFIGRRPRELAFRRGDIIFIVRRLDKNWCEGELNGVVGLFPLSYVEVIPYNEINMKFGRAMAKYDFVPQTPLELSARKGDMITLLRKIDENWFEGRIGDRAGIIPASYCHILAIPQTSRAAVRSEKVTKPVASPAAHSLIHNGSGLSSKHCYAPYLSSPTSPGRSTVSSASANQEGSFSADMLIDEALLQLDEELDMKRSNLKPVMPQPLNVRINPRPEPALYQVLFNHVPNNDDELELIQGETVTVVEKCGDGWYIGSKMSDGKLGIFPGTHVRKISSEFV